MKVKPTPGIIQRTPFRLILLCFTLFLAVFANTGRAVAAGEIVYSTTDGIYRVQAVDGAQPENLSTVLDTFWPGGSDIGVNVSHDGEWIIFSSDGRFDCNSGCVGVLTGDLSAVEPVKFQNGSNLRWVESLAIAAGGNLIVYRDGGGSHVKDLWAITRVGNAWSDPVELTAGSSFDFNSRPSISADGSKVIFSAKCSNCNYPTIAQVNSDGTGFSILLNPEDGPYGQEPGGFSQPVYAPGGSIVFESDWVASGGAHELIWRLSAVGATPEIVASYYGSDNSPCVLPDGRIVSLRYGGGAEGYSYHQLKVMNADGSNSILPALGAAVLDIGYGCGSGSGGAGGGGSNTVTYQQGLDGYVGAADARIGTGDWGAPAIFTRNFGHDELLSVSERNGDHALLRFDLSDIPENSNIISATLELYNNTNVNGKQRSIRLHRVMRDWHEGNQSNSAIDAVGEEGVTGINAFDYFAGAGDDEPWGTNGMAEGSDFVAVAEDTTTVGDAGWYQWDVAALVQSWVNNTQSNFGVVMRDPDEWQSGNTIRRFYSAEYAANTGFRPKLSITYEDGTQANDSDNDGMPDDWELANGLNPFDPADADLDNDGDGATNLEEYINGTDPNSAAGGGIFPAEHYPNGAHPRLWLTQDRMSELQQARQNDTPQWKAFKKYSDQMFSNNYFNELKTSGLFNYQIGTAPLALMYRLTGESQYADRALELMDMSSPDLFFINNNGDSVAVYANPDHARFHYLGLAYDWLYDYAGMTTAKKQAYQQKMITLSNNFWNEYNGQGIDASNGDTDLNLLTGMMHLTLGAAIYGDNSGALSLLDRGWLGWDAGYGWQNIYGTGQVPPPEYSNSDYLRESSGGVYPTGFRYFAGSDSVGIVGYQMTLGTACNYDVNSKHPELAPFWGNTIRSIIHLTDPKRENIYHTGDWEDHTLLNSQPWFYQMLATATHMADKAGDHDIAAKGRGYAQQLDLGNDNGWFAEFFFASPSASVTDPYQSNLPLVHFSKDPGFLMFRDNWTENANWGLFIGDGGLPVDHQKPDHGSFSLWRGNDYLTRGARTYDGLKHGEFFNSLSIENGCVSCSGTAIRNAEAPAKLSRHRVTTSGYTYAMLNADGQWNEDPVGYQPNMPVDTYRRHFFWAGDYAVVFDRLRTHYNNGSKYRLRALTQPSVNGNTISQLSENGQHKLLSRTLEPASVSIQVVNEHDLWQGLPGWVIDPVEHRWQSVIDLPFTDSVNVLNVMQMGDASLSSFDTLEHIQNTEQSGVRIGDRVVMFSAEEVLLDHVLYTVHNPSAGLKHLVADLSPGTYQVKLNGNVAGQPLTVQQNDNTGYFTSDEVSSTLSVELTLIN